MQGYLKKRNERGVAAAVAVLQGLELKHDNRRRTRRAAWTEGGIPVMTVQSAEHAGAIGGENHCFEIKVSSALRRTDASAFGDLVGDRQVVVLVDRHDATPSARRASAAATPP